jgi:hypothetical protein
MLFTKPSFDIFSLFFNHVPFFTLVIIYTWRDINHQSYTAFRVGIGMSNRVRHSFGLVARVDRLCPVIYMMRCYALIPIYGKVPAGQNAQEGGYSDTILVTVNF